MPTPESNVNEQSTEDEQPAVETSRSRWQSRVVWTIATVVAVLIIAATVVLLAWYRGFF